MKEICKNWSTWLKQTRFSYLDEAQKEQTLNWLISIRNQVLDLAELKEGQKIADFGCGTGLLSFGILERFSNKVELIFSDKFEDCLSDCKKILNESNADSNAKFLQSDILDIKLPDNYLDRALTRSVLVHVLDKKRAFNELYRVVAKDGLYCAFEPIISQNTRYYELLLPNQVSDYFEFRKAEKEFMESPLDPLVNFSAQSLDEDLTNAGFSDVLVDVSITASRYVAKKENIDAWFISPPAPDQKSMKQRFLDYFDEKKVDNFILEVKEALGDKEVNIKSQTALIKARK